MRMRRLFWEHSNKSPNSQALQDAMGVLEGMAIFDGQEHETAVRISGDDNCIFVDLANEAWQAVKITADGYEVIDNPPVKFIRPRGVLPLPIPESGGTLDELRPFINVADEQSFVLLVLRGGSLFPVSQTLSGRPVKVHLNGFAMVSLK